MTETVFQFKNLEFGTILGNLLKQDTITNINFWYGRLIINDNDKGEYEYDLSKHSQEEIDEFNEIIEKLPNRLSNRMVCSYNEGAPILDAECEFEEFGRLRINVIHPSVNGSSLPSISIRRTRKAVRINSDFIIESGYATKDILNLLRALVDGGNNIMISGITNAGKTELLRYIAGFIRDNESIITIEDTREAYLQENYPNKHVLALKSNSEKDFSDLIRTSLRQNPTWICVSETRGEEVLDLLNACETGHKLISTIHCDSAVAIANRMVSMARAADGTETRRISRQIYDNIDVGIYIFYYEDANGSHRQIAEICEYYNDENGNPMNHMLIEYDYGQKQYRYNRIQSNRIKRNLLRKQTDTEKVKELFL